MSIHCDGTYKVFSLMPCMCLLLYCVWETESLGFPGTCSGSPFSPPVKLRGLENGVFSFSGILSVLPEIYGICLLKSRPLLLHRHEGHRMDNLKG